MCNSLAKGAEFAPSFFFKGCRRSVARNGALFWSAAVWLSPRRARPFLRRGEGGGRRPSSGRKGKFSSTPTRAFNTYVLCIYPLGKQMLQYYFDAGRREEGRASGRWGFRHLSPTPVLSPSSIFWLNQSK